MKRGSTILCGIAVVAVGACAAKPELQIRPTKAPLSMQQKPVPIRIAEARGQLALGNVALALESFRKAAREDPNSTDALVGIAACYDQMGRFDLSRRNYEAALAIAPGDVQLLEAFAASLTAQGLPGEAAAVRQEIAMRRDAEAPAVDAAAIIPPPAAASAPLSLVAESMSVLPQQQQLASLDVPIMQTQAPDTPSAPAQPAGTATDAIVPKPADLPVQEEATQPKVGRTVTISLPPPRPAVPEDVPAAKAAALDVQVAQPDIRTEGPRLERLSLGEVALITGPGPLWRSEAVARTAQSTTVRFVPLKAAAQTARIRLLNAARVHRLAARTRNYLGGHGWRSVSIGDARKTRVRSLILYPADQRSVALRLSNQFGFAVASSRNVRQVTVLLGRDAAQMDRTRRS